MTLPTISALPTEPSRTDPSTFASRGDAFVAALATFRTEINAFGVAVDALVLRTQRSLAINGTLVESDRGQIVNCTAALTLGTTAAATLGNGWWCYVRNTGTGNVTVDPNASETIDDQASGLIYPGFLVMILCTGSAFIAFRMSGMRREVLTSGTSWTHQAIGVRRVRGRGAGAGGGGGRESTGNKAVGGGAGAYAEWEFATSLGTAYTYAIGAAGNGATSNGVAGGAGGNTTFNTGVVTVTMAGGAGGLASTGSTVAGGAATNGDINLAGGGGSTGRGGDSRLGAGGIAATSNQAATGYGAGGYGEASGINGGAGTPGAIILEF